ncbi:hypothetical protein NW754_001467 [Fusarium falciforme]|uniref:AB hydrolase-1 domain-containing protein n=1 Tax=Fusarium falciforme TaxID=195108 RepID=A0A9W8UTZ1_9HYPO|nr:hypothetical protein NW754_001467 [Fusarium falciforme]KAJ4175678.1 hypothetical protein NW755_014809 [Fusarium falciforme]KAJ4176670.1 hypothetical protein NW767_015371 [Fusarium falciforme]KAJ4179683.1 hypothetical protein NW759_017284 [Fusarium solani]KAJ4226087.1 hypothetical protein NW757_014283 [Fusarium falciforme]
MTKSRKSTVNVPHLGGIDAAYLMPEALDNSKPTLILIHGFMMSSEVYDKHYNSTFLKERVNLIGIDLLGHGETRTKNETFTYWDSAIMGLQVMEALGVKRSFVLGTSQGGWVAARMCLLAPDKVRVIR